MAWKPAYVSTQDLWQWGDNNTGTVPEEVEATYALCVESASRSVDFHCNRQFGQVSAPVARYYTAQYDRDLRKYIVEIDDLQELADLAVESVASGDIITDYTLGPRNAIADGKAYTRMVINSGYASTDEGDLKVTARWGWTDVPGAVKQATLLQASRLRARPNSPLGVASGTGNESGDLRLLDKVDPDLAVILRPYVRWWAVA